MQNIIEWNRKVWNQIWLFMCHLCSHFSFNFFTGKFVLKSYIIFQNYIFADAVITSTTSIPPVRHHLHVFTSKGLAKLTSRMNCFILRFVRLGWVALGFSTFVTFFYISHYWWHTFEVKTSGGNEAKLFQNYFLLYFSIYFYYIFLLYI